MVTLILLEVEKTTPIQQWHFKDSTVIRIGRSVDNDIVLSNYLVSRHHLEIRQISNGNQGNYWQVISKGTNGTYLNGIFLNGDSVITSTLPDKSLIQLAKDGPLLKFQLQDESDSDDLSTQSQHQIKPTFTTPTHPDLGCTHQGNSPNNLFCIHCGQPISVQKTIRQYQVLRTLGQGGMGTTYLACNTTNLIMGVPQRLVLKQMNADMAKIPKAQELFQREAKTLKNLNHVGIPKYYDFFVEDGKKYLAMELIDGQDLEHRVNFTGPVTQRQAIAWMIQTCDVLEYIHSQDPPLIHRDIKPANLMARNSDNRIVVLDFGAVKEKEAGTAPGTKIGAEGYSAPEQNRGQPLTQSDLYAIGPTLIFLLTGENPYKFYRQRGRGYHFDLTRVPTITHQLRAVIEHTTEPLVRDRYQTAKELKMALAECISG
ncbi:protein kinase [Cronbergia sp. UHCC 0137]|uniref:protein kinase domain-containing protein n=1 Tax=Cronbergia sp. UHCC 0137 TaxID=3110239 RepID=UPI002B1FA4D8|nr:protein kinase [Cronbergia sp. UHCC 0137]MEA5616566.1 protein kinase [Cronbergia sp. UHCC 0137]